MAIWEVVPVTVKSGTADDFEAVFRSNVPLLAGAKGCLDVKLLRAVDKQSTFVILVQWESVESHIDVFTKSEAYAKLGSATGPFFAALPELFHAATVIDGFSGHEPAEAEGRRVL
jgi:heme-degrading monooxygenase HmoA